MTNRKGPRFERELLDYLRGERYDAERLRLTGTEDEGDLAIRLGFVVSNSIDRIIIEAKNVARMDLAGWVAEAETEAENYAAHRNLATAPGFIVVHKRKGKGVAKSYVTTTLEEYLRQIG